MHDTDRPLLVTGAAGFAGSHLLEALAGTGEIVAWARTAPPPALAPLARWRQIDLLQAGTVRAAIDALKPRAVYHCAGRSQASGSWRDGTPLLAANVLGTHHLLEAIRRAGAACRVLVPGSALVYAPSEIAIREEDRLAPSGPYALSKLAQEQLGLRAARDDGIEVIVTRSFNHTGPRQSDAFVAPAMARQIALIERGAVPPVIRVGNLDAVRDISDVRDVARAYRLLMDRGEAGVVYNVASGVGTAIRSLLDLLVSQAQRPVLIDIDPARMRPHDLPQLVGDVGRLQAATGWRPVIPLDRTIADLLAFWRDRVAGGAT